jgi:outer membrane protein
MLNLDNILKITLVKCFTIQLPFSAFALYHMLFCKKISMKNGLLIFNVILLILVGVLFYLHFSSNGNKEKRVVSQSTLKTDPAGNDFRIAYFELDSITNSFSMVKDIKNDLNREEEKMNGEMNQWQKRYNDKLQQYQSQAQQMNQVQSENANRDMLQMQETIRNKKQELDQKYQNLYMQKMQDVKIKIENFLKEYNKSKGYSYIFAYEPGFIYYRDTMFNITADLVKGLNEQYSKKK